MKTVAVLVMLASGCRDQEAACRQAFDDEHAFGHTQVLERCIRERWSDRKIECKQRAGGLVGLFCED